MAEKEKGNRRREKGAAGTTDAARPRAVCREFPHTPSGIARSRIRRAPTSPTRAGDEIVLHVWMSATALDVQDGEPTLHGTLARTR
jgi:hypothetical protein